MELIQIVDDQDRPISAKERRLVDVEHDIYRVSVLWIVNSKNQALLARRSFNKTKNPGKWGPAVAGTVAAEQTYDDNIRKEALEEIGLSLEGLPLAKGPRLHIAGPSSFFCQYYFLKLDRDIADFTRQQEEVEALAWVDIDQIKREAETNPEKYVPNARQTLDKLGL